MENIFGFLLLFFIQLFFLNLGISGTLSKTEKKIINDNTSLLLKCLGLYIFKLRYRKIYKIMIFLIFLLSILNIACFCILKVYETNIIRILLDVFIKISFLIIPFLIILNIFDSKRK